MKIKQSPEDFIVKEMLPDGFIKKKGKYKVYLLKKKGVTTSYCLNFIKQRFHEKIGYCGNKDKHALTYQYITMQGGGDMQTKHFSLKFAGYSDKHLKRGMNKGNKFTIRVEITPQEKRSIKEKLPAARKGFVNYFGPQRTGRETIKKSFTYFLLKGDYKTALLRYYINKSKLANRELKKRYKECFKHWGDNEWCFNHLKGYEKNITIRPLKEKDYFHALKKIPKNEIEMLVASYQALLWNKNPKPSLPVIKTPLMKARKGKRKVIVKPEKLSVRFEGNYAIFQFILPAGSYATTLLNVFKIA